MNFSINQIPLRLFLGVPEEERGEAQEVLVTVTFSVETAKAAFSDEIEASLDYSLVYDLVASFGERHEPVKLLEKLHRLLKEDLMASFPGMNDLKVSIEKFPFRNGSVIIKD